MALHIYSGTTYYIVNSMSKKVMELSKADHISVIANNLNRGENQQWEAIYHEGNGKETPGWYIRSVSQGKYLRLSSDHGLSVVATREPFVWHLWSDPRNVTTARITVPSTALNGNTGLSVPSTDTHGFPHDVPILANESSKEGRYQFWSFEKVVFTTNATPMWSTI